MASVGLQVQRGCREKGGCHPRVLDPIFGGTDGSGEADRRVIVCPRDETMTEPLKQRIQNGERLVVFAVGRMYHHNIIQYLGMAGGFDGFWIDVEHAGLTVRDVEIAVAAGKAHGLESFVRVPPTDYATVTRCFESGAVGVMAAQIASAEHAEEFVQWSKFAPRGRRGLNPLGYDGAVGGCASRRIR